MVILDKISDKYFLISFANSTHLYELESEKSLLANLQHAHQICVSTYLPNRKLIIFSDIFKNLVIYDLSKNSYLDKKIELPKRAVKFMSSKDEVTLFIADKTGDVYTIDFNDANLEPKLLMGHLSTLLDISLTNDEKHIITCDRDEKIRISQYPKSYNIETYLLGHKEFVKQIQLIENDKLLSSSGDLNLILWSFETSRPINKFDLSEYVDQSADNKENGIYKFFYDHNSGDLMVNYFRTNYLVYFTLINGELTYQKKFHFDCTIHEFSHLTGNNFFFTFCSKENPLQTMSLDNNEMSPCQSSNLSNFLTEIRTLEIELRESKWMIDL